MIEAKTGSLNEPGPKQDNVRAYITKAEGFNQAAEFEEALKEINAARNIYPNLKNINQVEAEIKSTAEKYEVEISAAKEALSKKEFSEALSACERASKLCPQAEVIKSLEHKIKLEQAVQSGSKRRERAECGRRVTFVVVAFGIIALIVGIVTAFFVTHGSYEIEQTEQIKQENKQAKKNDNRIEMILKKKNKQIKVAWIEEKVTKIDWKSKKGTLTAVVWDNGRLTSKNVFEQIWADSEENRLWPLESMWSPDGRYLAIRYNDGRDHTSGILLDTFDNSVRKIGIADRIQWITSDFLFIYHNSYFNFPSGGTNVYYGNGYLIYGFNISKDQAIDSFLATPKTFETPWYKTEPHHCPYCDAILMSPCGNLLIKLCNYNGDPTSYVKWWETDELCGYPDIVSIQFVNGDIIFKETGYLLDKGIVYPCRPRSAFSNSDRFIALPIYETKENTAEKGGKYGDFVREISCIKIWERKKDNWKEVKKLNTSVLSACSSWIRTILWDMDEKALLVEYYGSQINLPHSAYPRIELLDLKEEKAKYIVSGTYPQWVDGKSLFVYCVEGKTKSGIKEIRMYDITLDKSVSLIELDESSEAVSVWTPVIQPK